MAIDMQRVGTDEQIADVVRLAREIWEEHYTGLIGCGQVAFMLERFQSPVAITTQIAEGYAYYLALSDGRPEGYFAVVAEPGTSRLLLSKLYLRQSCRGLGVGRQILDFVETLGRRQGCRTLWLTVNKRNPTLGWYERQGFVRAAAIVQDIGGGYVMDDYRMEKQV